jgi:hypothetical protein
MKLKATNPLVLFVGALAIGLAGCADDVIITEPPPPPPPPPPEAAEISIQSITDADTNTEIGTSEDDPIGGTIGVIVNFDTGGFEAAALSVFVDDDEVPCQTFSGQAAVGLAGDVQRVQCLIDTQEGIGACQGSTLLGRFDNGAHIISAELTLGDGSSVSATRSQPLLFSNSNSIIVVPDDIGPRVVGLDERGWWGGPRDLSWFVCPTIFTASLDDVCEISVASSNTHAGDALALRGTNAAPLTTDVLEEPFRTTADYREIPALLEGIANPDWTDSKSLNEDRVESPQTTGVETLSVTKVLACDGTNISTSFSLGSDSRPIDSSAPLCDDADDECQVWIDAPGTLVDFPITDDAGDGNFVVANALFSGGGFELREPGGADFADGGVGFVQGQTLVLNAWDYGDGTIDDFVLFLEDVAGPAELDEDDACGNDGTTDPALGAADFANAYGQCALTGEEGRPVDAYAIQIARVGDLLLNELGDGTADIQIEDEFITEVLDAGAGTGVVISGQAGADFTEPEIDPDELQPPADDPLFVWNPDLNFDGVDDLTRTCPSALNTECETLMWEAVDPDLASGDPGSGVEDVACDPGPCIDANGDGDWIITEIDASPTWDDGIAAPVANAYKDNTLVTNNAGLAADMFQALICDGTATPGTPAELGGAQCNGEDDGTYTVTHTVPDKAMAQNNVAEASYSFILDVSPPIIGFGGITGLNASNAATVEFVLDASVVDRNGDGTAVTSAVVQVTARAGLGGVCPGDLVTEAATGITPEGGNDDATGTTVIADVTSEVNANGGDFTELFTAAKLAPLGGYTYCFELTADDGAARKDGTDDGVDVNSDASKDFTWQ